MKDRKILKVGSRYMITLPMDIVKGFGWDENTRIKINKYNRAESAGRCENIGVTTNSQPY